MVTIFQQKLAEGRLGENDILRFMWRNLDYIGAPLSKIEDFKDRGPRLYLPNRNSRYYPRLLPVPDLLCIKMLPSAKEAFDLPLEFWLEAKNKGKCSWYRINKAYQSGIDKRYWQYYLQVGETTRKPVWLFHLIHPTLDIDLDKQGAPQNKRPAPTGLYAHPVTLTPAFDPNRKPMMIYWRVEAMHKIAELAEVMQS